MDIGLNLPIMAPGLDRTRTLDWCRRIDDGPWSSLAAGDRIAYPNPELLTLLGAAAVATERVRLVTNVAVMGLRDPVLLAKQLATIDVLSDGRLTVGVGVGGREEDHLAVGGSIHGPRVARMAADVDRMRSVWEGERSHPESLRPVEPFPVQDGGPPILVGALGHRSIQTAATYADGLLSFSFGMATAEVDAAFAVARAAWATAGRPAPRLVTGAFVALGPDPDTQMATYLRRYLNFLGPTAEQAIPIARLRSRDALRETLDAMRDVGADEVLITPTTVDPDEVDRLADACFG